MKNETTFTEAIEYLEKHIDSTDVKATTNLKILSDFIEEQFKTEKFEKRKKKAIKRQVKLYEKARLDVANTAEDFMKGLSKYDLKRLMSDSKHIKKINTYGQDVKNSRHYVNDWCTREYVIEMHPKDVDGRVNIYVPVEGNILKAGIDRVYKEPILRVEIFKNGIMIDSYVLEWFMADAFLPFQNAKKVLRGLCNDESPKQSSHFETLMNILTSRYPETLYQ